MRRILLVVSCLWMSGLMLMGADGSCMTSSPSSPSTSSSEPPSSMPPAAEAELIRACKAAVEVSVIVLACDSDSKWHGMTPEDQQAHIEYYTDACENEADFREEMLEGCDFPKVHSIETCASSLKRAEGCFAVERAWGAGCLDNPWCEEY